MWTSDVADGGPTPQMPTLALDAQGLCSNVTGQQVGFPSGFCVQRRPLCWFLQQLAACVSLSEGSLSTLFQGTLRNSFMGWVVKGVAGRDPVAFLGHSQLVTVL